MSRVLTNNTALVFGVQSALDATPTAWTTVEFDALKRYGAEIKKVARRPISKLRSRRKGTTVDLDAGVEFDTDLTVDAVANFLEGFMFSQFANKEFNLRASSATVPPPVVGATDDFTIDAASATLAGKIVWVTASVSTLFFAKGYTNAINNGFHELSADVASTDTAIQVTTNLVTETPPTNASLQICGVRVNDDADLTLTVSGSTATLVSAAAIADWSVLGLRAGMFIHIGGVNLTTGAVARGLGSGGTTSYGFARITSVSTSTLNLDKLATTLSTASGPASAAQDVLFGRFVRNVPVDAATTDNEFVERYYQFEGAFPDLGGVGTPQYEYVINCLADQLTLNLPLTDKGSGTWAFIGTTAQDITSSRKSGASSAVDPLRVVAFGTASDVAAISTDLISSASDVGFKSLTLTLKNNVSAEKVLGTLGARFMNAGLFEVGISGQMLFTTAAIINSIKNNVTVTFLSIVANEDGAICLDIPEMTVGDGKRDFPQDQTVLVNVTAETHRGATLTYDLGVSLLAIAPWN